MSQREFDVIDLVSVMSLAVGYKNLIENREQSAHNDVSAANEAQANYLLDELADRFEQIEDRLNMILEELRNDSK